MLTSSICFSLDHLSCGAGMAIDGMDEGISVWIVETTFGAEVSFVGEDNEWGLFVLGMERGFFESKREWGGGGRGVKEKEHGDGGAHSLGNDGALSGISNTVDNVGKVYDGLNSSPTKVTPRNSTMNKEGNLHEENHGRTPIKSIDNPNKGNGVDVAVLVKSIRAISERFANTTYGFFLGKYVAYPVVANYLHGGFGCDALKWSMIYSQQSTYLEKVESGCEHIQRRCRSSYARALFEVQADVELKDNIVVAMPKLVAEGSYTCNDECPKNKVSDVVKNMKKPSQTHRGVPVGPKVGFQPTKQVYGQVSKKNNVSTSDPRRSSFWNVDSNSTSTTPIVEKIDKMERLIIDGMATLIDDEGKPLTRVDSSGDHDSEDEVASVDNDIANFRASKDVGYGTNSLLEQWKESYGNGEHDYDSYDDDMYEGHDILTRFKIYVII
ncbi:hypothetical protein Tco_1069826 [Tanacetum coccineum]|uniref:Uncharacterized protein n=1 Tax=Tanacetum coccineum TaxID=301880 RepID=A0ABQ5HL11_9ASTR